MARRPDIDQELAVITCDSGIGAIAATSPVAATGTITCVAKVNLVDADFMTIGDGVQVARLFEFDVAGNGVTSGRVQVDVSTDTTAAQVAARLRTAILATFPALSVVDNADGTLTVNHRWPGAGGNITMTETVANAGFLVAGLSGGVDAALAATVASTTTIKYHAVPRVYRVEPNGVEWLTATTVTQNATDYWDIELKNGSISVAKWSSQTSQQGTITGGTSVTLVNSATDASLVFQVGDHMSLVLTKHGSPAALPPGRLTVHGRYVS